MKISELRARQGSVNLEATVKSIEEPRTFNKFGRDLRVTNAVIEDDSGSIKLTLWNNDVDSVHAGDIVKVTNGFINEFKGENQLTTGKFGKLEVVKHGSESRGEAEKAGGEDSEDDGLGDDAGEDAGEELGEDY
jgi:replication factor A1